MRGPADAIAGVAKEMPYAVQIKQELLCETTRRMKVKDGPIQYAVAGRFHLLLPLCVRKPDAN